MQLSAFVVIAIAELYVVLLLAGIFLVFYIKKLKTLIRRQQDKLVDLKGAANPLIAPGSSPEFIATQNYKAYLNKEIAATSSKFEEVSPEADIALEQAKTSPEFQRILALRYAFLRAEELGTTEERGTLPYWHIFQEALIPLLSEDAAPAAEGENDAALAEELATAKKRIENLEKFKKLFFELEKQFASAQENAQDYYAQLMALAEGIEDRETFNSILDSYHSVYDGVHSNISYMMQNPDTVTEHKTINITRQDPRAAEEIIKLRNVAADQHRIINQLQRRLIEARTSEEKELVIQELQQQLQRQTRFVQESETCVQLLEDELNKVHLELNEKEKVVYKAVALEEENEQMKSTLHSFTLESKDMMSSINELEKENESLKKTLTVPTPTPPTTPEKSPSSGDDLKKIQTEFHDLKRQYAELEEKYLDLKLGG